MNSSGYLLPEWSDRITASVICVVWALSTLCIVRWLERHRKP